VTGPPHDRGGALERRLAEAEAREEQLAGRLEAALSELERDEAGSHARVIETLGRAEAQLKALRHRQAAAEQRVIAAEAVAAAARRTLTEERAWVADQAQRVAVSQAWRLGHMAVRQARRLSFRRDCGTDALSAIVARMSVEDDAARAAPPPR
jgi:hypothetical protein